MLWDVDGGLPLVDKYLYSNDNHVVAGALLAVGIINCGVRNECDPVGECLQFVSVPIPGSSFIYLLPFPKN